MNSSLLQLGGNTITRFDSRKIGRMNFAECSYTYYQELLETNTSLLIDELSSYTLFILDLDCNGYILIENTNIKLYPGDSIKVSNQKLNFICKDSKVRLIVSGVKNFSDKNKLQKITRKGYHYKVDKPWGHELWINGDEDEYCLKEIYLIAKNQTSLQYHLMKEETNVLYKGDIEFVYKMHIDSEEKKYLKLSEISSIHVKPNSVHRIRALSNVLLYETSTPHLKDVIRIEDDTDRADGHIISEHQNNKS